MSGNILKRPTTSFEASILTKSGKSDVVPCPDMHQFYENSFIYVCLYVYTCYVSLHVCAFILSFMSLIFVLLLPFNPFVVFIIPGADSYPFTITKHTFLKKKH